MKRTTNRTEAKMTLTQSLARAEESAQGLCLRTAEEHADDVAYAQECQFEMEEEKLYEAMLDYKAWLRDGWQPAWAQ